MIDVNKPLAFSRFGADEGRTVVYFHGAPGAPAECRVFDRAGKKHGLAFVCFDRFAMASSLRGERYFEALAVEISVLLGGAPIDIVGFSIGAFVALQTCRYLANPVRTLHLISAAAPLEAGGFLDAMAGKAVFRLAQRRPVLFMGLARGQGLLASFLPNMLFNSLFSSARGEDRLLAADPAFRADTIEALRACFVGNAQGYARDIAAYVGSWQGALAGISADTHLWHGAEDNWSPVSMAAYLQSAIPGSAATLFNGLSHYSCLYRAVPEICEQLGIGHNTQQGAT